MEVKTIECKENFDITNMTTFKVGGIVKKIYFPTNQQEFVYLLQTIKNPLIIGGASNILFSSQGYDGVIISTVKMSQVSIRGTRVLAECGVKGPMASQAAYNAGLSGFEFMIGFPGTIGGNVFMNAGAHGKEFTLSDKYPAESEKFLSLPKELAQKYETKFKLPERFFRQGDKIIAVPYEPHRQKHGKEHER